MRRFVLLAALILLALMTVGAGQAFAATRWVDNDGVAVPPGSSCTKPGYNTIQSAVNASLPGDTINVCPGTYPEQVTVATAAKNNLTLRSVTPLAATIKAPLVMLEPGDLVTIDGSRNVTLRDFVVSGPLPDYLFCSLELRSGVRVKGNGSANILGNRITEIRSTNPALRGCQNGFAIAVGRTAEAQVGSATIVSNRLDRYQKGGIYVDNLASRAAIVGNQVLGEAALNTIAQNGIQISRRATAEIKGNLILDHLYITPPLADLTAASGIILFQAGKVLVEKNELQRNQDGIGLYTMLAGEAAILDNRIIGGASFDPALGTLAFGDGIYAGSDTAGNRIRGNFLRENAEHDCHDDSGATKETVRNVWQENDGVTSQPPGLCTRQDGQGGSHDDDDDDDDDDRRQQQHGGHHDD